MKNVLFLLLLGTLSFAIVDPFINSESNQAIPTTQTAISVSSRAFYIIQPTDGDIWVSWKGVTADSRMYVSNKQIIDTEFIFKAGTTINMTAVTATTNVYIGTYIK